MRYLDEKNVTGDAEPLGKLWEETGNVKEDIIGYCKIKSFKLKEFFTFMNEVFKRDKLALLKANDRKLFEDHSKPFKNIHHIGIVSKYKEKINDFINVLGYTLKMKVLYKI